MKIIKGNNIFKELELRENHVYKINVKIREANPEHTAILFAGFSSSAYCKVFHNSYENPIYLHACYSIQIVEDLGAL